MTFDNNSSLFDSEDQWITDLGKFFPGERIVVRGKDLFTELGELSWLGYLVHANTGLLLTDKQVRLFELIWTHVMSYPDPRLWNNRIAALAGTARSTATLATTAGLAVTEADLYGYRASVRSIDFFHRLKQRSDDGEIIKEIVRSELRRHRGILGFGRPLISHDERIRPVLDLAARLNLDNGEYLKLAFEVERILREGRWRLKLNAGGLAAALLAEFGFSSKDYAAIIVAGFTAGITPCYVEAAKHPEGSFFPLRVSRLEYKGKTERRKWNDGSS